MRSRHTENPEEIDPQASLNHARDRIFVHVCPKRGEVAIIAFRGIAAQVLLDPSRIVQDGVTALEYLSNGGCNEGRAREYWALEGEFYPEAQ